jgi:hypothetical protein
LYRILIGLPQVFSHAADEQIHVLISLLQEYKLLGKLGYVISDNHIANDKLCRLLRSYLLENEGILWDASHYRIHCIGHILNLAVQVFLFDEDNNTNNEPKRVKGKDSWREMGPLGIL